MGALAIATIGVSLFEAEQQSEAMDARQQALHERLLQETAATQQQRLKNIERVNKIMAAQTVAAASQGESLASPRLTQVQTSTLNQFAQDENAANLNLTFQKKGIEAQESVASAEGTAAIVGGIARSAALANNLYVPNSAASPAPKTTDNEFDNLPDI